MFVNDVPDREIGENESHIGYLEVNDRPTTLTNRLPYYRKKSLRIRNVFKNMTAADQIASMPSVSLSVEILDIGNPLGGRALHVPSLVGRIKTDPMITT